MCSNAQRWTTSLLLLRFLGIFGPALLATPCLAASEPLPLCSIVGVRLEMVVPAGPTVEVDDLLGGFHHFTVPVADPSDFAVPVAFPSIVSSGSGFTPTVIRTTLSGPTSGKRLVAMPARPRAWCNTLPASTTLGGVPGTIRTPIAR